jgi:hypothetical protein
MKETDIKIDNVTYKCVLCYYKYYEHDERNVWSGKNFFVTKLKLLNQSLEKHKSNIFPLDISRDCQICHEKNITHFMYAYKGYSWLDGLIHYIDKHNAKPPSKFIRFVLNNDPTIRSIKSKCNKSKVLINGVNYKRSNFTYLKVHMNQLLILDALMEHGGITRKYKEKHEKKYKYTEHAGMLDFDDFGLERVIISGTTSRTNEQDPDIFLPILDDTAYDYEYIFHTHPPTPRIAGRIIDGILYEFPSANDIFHFIEHHNKGLVQGSIVVTPEGLYNIRQYGINSKSSPLLRQPVAGGPLLQPSLVGGKINVPKNFSLEFKKVFRRVQGDAIRKYGTKIDRTTFFETIAQDTTAIEGMNEFLKKYNVCIDYFPRQKTKKNKWVIGTIYLPICVMEKV